ncbi:hypothetical protein DL93DRAFT_2158216 [Clavulina sp. PMI_390]|nr:hypothetical protein DL93DRAFT_2158216 [Clavulina sp. PMI_390]
MTAASLLRTGLALTLLAASHSARAAFTYTAPAQCDDMTITWSGGTAPFSLLLAPKLDTPRNISIPSSAYNGTGGSYTFQLQLAEETTFLLVLSDATKFGSLGTTSELTVNSSGDSCDTSSPTSAFSMVFNTTNLQQCKDFAFTGFSGASKPITVHGLIPEGTTFDITIPSSASNSYSWNADVALGTTVMFVPEDNTGKFGTNSDFLGVGSSSSSSCLNSTSPGTTSSSSPSSQTSGASHTTTGSGGATTSAHSGNGTNVGTLSGIVVGVIMGVILTALAIFCFMHRRYRHKRIEHNPLAYKDPELDLLPGGGVGVAGGGAGTMYARDPEDRAETGGAAHYPLAPRRGAMATGGAGPEADYEPVPYVLPPGEQPSPEYAPTDAGRTSTSTQPLSIVTGGAPYGYGVNGPPSSAGGPSSYNAPGNKGAMAMMDRQNTSVAPNAPARFVVHEDAGSVEGGDDEEGEWSEEEEVVDLPPQYDSLGALIPPERRPSRRRSTRRQQGAGEAPEGSRPVSTVPPVQEADMESSAHGHAAGPSS